MSNIDFNDILKIQTKNESLLELYRGGHKLWNSELDFIKFDKLTYKNTIYLNPSIINNEYCIVDWESQSTNVDGMGVTITYSLFSIKNNKNAEILTLFIPSNIFIEGNRYQRFVNVKLNILDDVNNSTLGIYYLVNISGAGNFQQRGMTPILEIDFNKENKLNYIEKLFNSNINFLIKNEISSLKNSKFFDIYSQQVWKELSNEVILKNKLSKLNLDMFSELFINKILDSLWVFDCKLTENIYNQFNIPIIPKNIYEKITESKYYVIENKIKTKSFNENSIQDYYIGYDSNFPEYLYVYSLKNLEEDIEYTLNNSILGNINYKYESHQGDSNIEQFKILHTNITSDLYTKLKNISLVGNDISINGKNYKIQAMNMCDNVLSKFYIRTQGIDKDINKIVFGLNLDIQDLFSIHSVMEFSYSFDNINYIKLNSNQYKLESSLIFCDILEIFKGKVIYFNLKCSVKDSIEENNYMTNIVREFKELVIQMEE